MRNYLLSALLMLLAVAMLACNKAPQTEKAPALTPAAGNPAPATNVVTTNFQAEGMHCDACEVAIDKAVRALPGVTNVAADYTTLAVAVTYDPAVLTPDAIVAAIEPLGYKATVVEAAGEPAAATDPATAENASANGAEAENCNTCADAKAVEELPAEVPAGMKRTSFLIPDMCCPGKAGRVTKALLVLTGISGCAADAATTTVTVDYDPQVIQPTAIIMAIKGAGFDATEQTAKTAG